MDMKLKNFFDTLTSTHTYVVWDQSSHDCVVIDPVLGFDPATQKTFETTTPDVIKFVQANELRPRAIIETHVHADHLTGSQSLKNKWPNLPIVINEKIREVQKTFAKILSLPPDFLTDGSQFDILVKDGDQLTFGNLEARVIHTPGHTPACTSYLFGDTLFVGDALFLPDVGSGRCDFPGGSAKTLYHSIHEKLYKLKSETKVCVGHDYPPAQSDRPVKFMSTIEEEKSANIHLKESTSLEEFVSFREGRDATLPEPRLLRPSLRANIQAGNQTY